MGVVAGMSEITSRSLLTANEQHVTLLYKSAGKLQRGGPVFDFLRNCVDGGHVESVRGMRLLQDGTGAVFDVPKEYAIDFVDKCCLLYTSPSPRDATLSRMPSSA